jgi:hypothetical protein
MNHITEGTNEKNEPLEENLLKQRLSLASFIIGLVSLGVFSWFTALGPDMLAPWIPLGWYLTFTCIFSAITLTGLVLGIISIKKGKKVFAILGCIINSIMIVFLGWAIYVFIYFMTAGNL